MSTKIELGQIILSRNLVFTTAANSFEVSVLVGLPQQFSSLEEDYYCPFKITGLKEDVVERAGGVDNIQALILALERIGKTLRDIETEKTGKFTWLDMDNLGFPVHDCIRLL